MFIKFIALIFALSAATAVYAHEMSTSYAKFRVEGRQVRVSLTLDLLGLHLGPRIDMDGDGFVSYDELDEGIESVSNAFKANYHIQAPDAPATAIVETYDFAADNILRMDIVYTFNHEVTDLKVTSTLHQITQLDHRHLLRIGEGADTRQAVLSVANPTVEIGGADGPSFFRTVWNFIRLGVEHIFTGYDHLAFLVGLLLTTATVLSLVKVVTSFTVAHSITLALATFELVMLPPRLIESLIALSIAYIAIENFTGKTLVHRWKITFLFGLVHGFGFANVLRQMELTRRNLAISLFSFNAGVEVGQLIFVLIVFPLIFYIGLSRWKEHFLSTASLAIMCLGIYWFVQRAFLT